MHNTTALVLNNIKALAVDGKADILEVVAQVWATPAEVAVALLDLELLGVVAVDTINQIAFVL
jgi:hypothetical protein